MEHSAVSDREIRPRISRESATKPWLQCDPEHARPQEFSMKNPASSRVFHPF
jgi:hypothetical protein